MLFNLDQPLVPPAETPKAEEGGLKFEDLKTVEEVSAFLEIKRDILKKTTNQIEALAMLSEKVKEDIVNLEKQMDVLEASKK